MKSSFSTPHVYYRHRQTGWMMLATACLPALCLCGWLAVTAPADRTLPPHLFAGLCVVTAVPLLGFASQSMTVTRDYLVAHFGIGLVRKSVALSEIVGAEVVRTRWYEGWGIHWTTTGMLYNVSGFDAVRVRLANRRTIRFGSDDAPRLAAAIRRAIDERRRPGAT